MAPSYSLLALALHASGAHAEAAFAHGGGICAAATTDLKTHIGLKGRSACNESSYPEEYISMSIEGLAFAKESDSAYLTDHTKMEVIERTPGRHVGPEAEIMDVQGSKVAVAKLGTMVGDLNPQGAFGFVGTASYLMLEGELMYNSNNFLVATADGQELQVEDVCIVPLQGQDKHCGADLRARPGKYKFSLYGYAEGEGYEQYIIDNEFLYLGFRQKYNVSHMGDNPEVAFNGGNFTPVGDINMGSTSINSMRIKGKTTLAMSFPQTYNVGIVSVESGFPVPVPAETKTIKIHAVRDTVTSFFIDYVFELKDGLEKKLGYFVYDPDIQVEGNSSGGGHVNGCVRIPKAIAEQFNAKRCS